MKQTGDQHGVYVCTTKGCKAKGKEVIAALPSVKRQATGTPLHCIECGQVMFLRRVETLVPDSA
jgi:hypothetical protein